MLFHSRTLARLILLCLPLALAAQNPIAVGSGSYAEYPPADIATWDAGVYNDIQAMLNAKIYVVDTNTRPIPTNDWWTDMLNKEAPDDEFGGWNWAYPTVVNPEPWGVRTEVMTKWIDGGNFALAQASHFVDVRGVNFTPADSRVRNWGDWTFDFVMQESASKYIAVTLGHGLPFTWVEFFGVNPELQFGGAASYFDDQGNALSLPLTTDHFGVSFDGKAWGIFAPENTRFSVEGARVSVTFSGTGKRFLVVAALTKNSDLSKFHSCAYNLPRDSRVSWNYDETAAELTTRWELTTENLRGEAAGGLIMGWIPHHWRTSRQAFAFNGMEYMTPRGLMKCAEGKVFELTYRIPGVLPRLPAPEAVAGANSYDVNRLRGLVAQYATKTGYDIETYAGAINLYTYAKYLDLAHELGMTAEYNSLKSTLRRALEDWLSYTPGEKMRYFCYYPNWKALVGLRPAFGSQNFIDHHFHYGYIVYAAGVLSIHDADFAQKFGPMAKLVAREYADWQRDDPLLPFLRTFDIWVGSSCASGLGNSGGGQNQESHSEAMNSWTGLYLLGVGTGDKAARDAGIFGWVQEAQAGLEYWFDIHRENHPPQYKHPVAVQLWHNQFVYVTHFNQEPVWKHGIIWMPIGPGSYYLAQDTAFTQWEYDTMLTQQRAEKPASTFTTWDDAIGNTVLQFLQLADPAAASAKFDELWSQNAPCLTGNGLAGITYAYTHANRHLGRVQRDWHLSIPTSQVYRAPEGGYHFVVYNPEPQDREVTVFQGDSPRYRFMAPARQLTTLHEQDAQIVAALPARLAESSGRQVSFAVPGHGVALRLPLAGRLQAAQIVDVRGRLIRALPAQACLSWDGRDRLGRPVGRGLYVLRLSSPGASVQKSFVLVR